MNDKSIPTKTPANVELSDEHVLKFLKENPAFFSRFPDAFNHIEPPERALGNGVVDFQTHQLKNLQSNSKELEHKYNGLIDFCRDNLSAQAEVHETVLRMIQVKSLDQLLEVIAVDMPALFNLDVVRLIVEAPLVENLNDNMDVWQQSGVTLVESGTIDAALAYKDARLVDNTAEANEPAIEDVFINAMGIARSAALMKLETPDLELPTMLAMGARQAGRFRAGQGVEQLQFLGKVLSAYLDRYLADLSM